jgi:hypothetical protein
VIDTEKIISKLSYKPGWSFAFEADQFYDVLVIRGVVPDSREPEMKLYFSTRRPVPDIDLTEDQFLLWVRQLLMEAEYHELREYFRYDGKLVDDPHKKY